MSEAKALNEMVFFMVGGANDAPGFKIVPDGHGGFKVVPVPGWNPEQAVELGATLKALGSVGRLKRHEAGSIVTSLGKLASSELHKLTTGGEAAAHAAVVVVVG